jgi:hypothetical protein
MTAEEHQLSIEMFKQQTLFYAGLVEILKSRDILEPGDLQAADALVIANRDALERHAEEDYRRIAGTLRLQTGLPPL